MMTPNRLTFDHSLLIFMASLEQTKVDFTPCLSLTEKVLRNKIIKRQLWQVTPLGHCTWEGPGTSG